MTTLRTSRPPILITCACTACGACLLTCPEHALRPEGGRLAVLEHCTGCLECLEICPANAISEFGLPGSLHD